MACPLILHAAIKANCDPRGIIMPVNVAADHLLHWARLGLYGRRMETE